MAAEEHGETKQISQEGARAGATEDVPIGAEKSNVLFQPTPDINFDKVFETLGKDTVQIAWVVFASILLLDALFIGGGIRGLFKSLFPASGMAGIVFYILSSVRKSAAQRKMAQSKPKTEKLRYVPESVEWMNTLTQTVWNVIQEEFFNDMTTMINDTIKPYIPDNVPASVKILKLGHGKNAARVLSMRSLPDEEFGELVPKHGDDHSGSVEERKRREEAVMREEGGIFYNLEIAVAYHASPQEPRTNHMHVDILTMIGPLPIPIFVEVKEFVATIRLRLQMHPDLPFLKNATFAMVEPPKINSAVCLGAPWTLDLLNLPIIDTFLESQINTLAKDFVQPKSMSVDMTLFLGGSDLKLDTQTIGVLCVKIHRATNLARQDTRGAGADPYLTIAFSKYEKPMYATRIIKGDLNPVWEESAIILIKPEHVKRQENVLLRLWDSDTMGSDDICGACEFPLQDLMLKSSKMVKRKDNLQGDVAGTDAQGILEWEVGYFPRAEYRKELRTDAQDPRDAHGDKVEVKEADKKQDAQNTVPDPELPSGILELTIHQCINVQVENPNKKSMGKVAAMHQDSDGEDDDERDGMTDVGYIPTLYVTADINDRLTYRTRVKSLNNAPTFNSTTEQYIRDWRVATLTVGVWDTRKKSDDCLVGLVSLKVSDIFHEASSSVKFYDLVGGAGTGRIRLSMIFRSMNMKLDKSLLGFEVGTFTFTSPLTVTGQVHHHALTLKGSGSSRRVKSVKKGEGDIDRIWTLDKDKLINRLPIQYRYHSPVVLEFASAGISDALKGPLGRQKHYAVLWLFKLIDNQSTKFTLPIYKTDNPARFTQNVVTQPDETMSLEKVGEVSFVGRFTAGLDESFEEFVEGHDAWTTYTTWSAARKAGESASRSLNIKQ
ncbi:C2 domain protein [Protomyces lactucae-debilis]|uniref:C2 domain protein n=1 Tax=Protomyces lactucae-debilis TaxID=2754530 RepID=A0A1Y2F1Z7_PROLT|nr:C2 domain protein [Protomyces lactucae-debilis]ORY77376.1 C2 domain protein [Protomyces lactucae-debilis]